MLRLLCIFGGTNNNCFAEKKSEQRNKYAERVRTKPFYFRCDPDQFTLVGIVSTGGTYLAIHLGTYRDVFTISTTVSAVEMSSQYLQSYTADNPKTLIFVPIFDEAKILMNSLFIR